MPWGGIVILDYGSQYTQLTARKIRAQSVFSQIVAWTATREEVLEYEPRGVILSGGPSSVCEEGAPGLPFDIWSLGLPVVSEAFIYRMSITRAQSLSLAVLMLAFDWLLRASSIR